MIEARSSSSTESSSLRPSWRIGTKTLSAESAHSDKNKSACAKSMSKGLLILTMPRKSTNWRMSYRKLKLTTISGLKSWKTDIATGARGQLSLIKTFLSSSRRHQKLLKVLKKPNFRLLSMSCKRKLSS